METKTIRVFDATLRDGESSPGASMRTEEQLKVAEQLVRLNVDIIEAGFPAASPGELEAVRQITRHARGQQPHAMIGGGLVKQSRVGRLPDSSSQPCMRC